LINTYILVPFEMEYLRTIAFIVTIAGVVGFTELVVNKTSPVLHQSCTSAPSSRSRILENNTNTKEKPIAAPKPYTADAKNPLS
jgi:hypothetical protein